MQSRLALAALALGAAVLVSSCSKSTSSTAPPNPTTGPTFSLAFPATGTSNKLPFTDLGSWGYHCNAHASVGMVGTIIVDTLATADSALVQVGAGGLNFSPSTVSIKPGGYVRWVNVSALTNHTATR